MLLLKAQELLDASEIKREAEDDAVQAGYETAMACGYDGMGVSGGGGAGVGGGGGHDGNTGQGQGQGDRDVATIAYHAAVLKSEEVTGVPIMFLCNPISYAISNANLTLTLTITLTITPTPTLTLTPI